MKKISPTLLLLLILSLAAFLRFWQLGSVPVSPDWDEAALGYNAYSIFKTGRDEYGTQFPLTLRSFDDYKPPLYMYLAVPFVGFLGLDTWVVRLPSAICGVLAVWGTYILVGELVVLMQQKEKEKQRRKNSFDVFSVRWLPVLATGLVAISPWHIQFSRIAFEANIGLTINIWAIVAFLKGVKNSKWLYGSAGLFGLGFYAYHSERVFLPLFVIMVCMLFFKQLVAKRRDVLIAAVIGIIVVAPLLPVLLDKNTTTRLRFTSSLGDQTKLLWRSAAKTNDDIAGGDKFGILFHNRRIEWAKTILSGYLSHYSLLWLFLIGDNDRHHAPGMGLLYLWELPFLLAGMYTMARRGGKPVKFLFAWFLIAPVAAAPTTEVPHAIRTLVFLPTFQIFVGYGLLAVYQRLKQRGRAVAGLGLLIVGTVAVFNFAYYVQMYFIHMNHEYSRFWQYGYKEAVEYVQANRSKYKKIVVSTKLEQPHMFFLYFLRYDPAKYLAEGGTASGGFEDVRNKFDIFEFRDIKWYLPEIKDGSVLYIGRPDEIPDKGLKVIKYLDGIDAMHIADR